MEEHRLGGEKEGETEVGYKIKKNIFYKALLYSFPAFLQINNTYIFYILSKTK